jgi:hypothetical protein
MKAIRFLVFLALAVMAVILVVRPFNGKVVGLPSEEKPYDGFFITANEWFDSVAAIHTQEIPILEKVELKLYYLGRGLSWEKDGKMEAFTILEEKLDTILGQPGTGLPAGAISDFYNANYNFDSVSTAHTWKGELPSDVEEDFLTSNAYFDTVRLIHGTEEDTLFADSSELWRIEQKLWNLNQALKNKKHALKGSYQDLEAKLDTLLGEYFISEDIDAYFDTADYYFDSVDVVHQQVGGLTEETDILFELSDIYFDSVNVLHEHEPPLYPEWDNIQWKIYYLNFALKLQKEGKYFAFWELEAKLDTLLGWEFPGMLNPDAEGHFWEANEFFDSVYYWHVEPRYPEPQNIEWKLYWWYYALFNQKHFKWLMFYDLEYKLDSLLHWENVGIPKEVDSLFFLADSSFDSVYMIHNFLIYEGEPEDWKVMQKLYYFNQGLRYQKDAMWRMFKELEFKLDILAEPRIIPLPELPLKIDSLFMSANDWFDSVDVIYGQLDSTITWRVEWMIHYLKHALKDEKNAKWMAFDELKRKAYEFDKVELKLYYMAKALQHEKDAKMLLFAELERKLDLLLGIESQGLPPEVQMDFDQANLSFDAVDSIHHKVDTLEVDKMDMKLWHLGNASILQKHAVWKMFDTLNVKINAFAKIPEDSLDPDIVADFDSADLSFGLLFEADQFPGLTDLQKIELKIFYLSHGEQFVKAAMEKMFAQWKEKLFEFDKLEKKAYYLGEGSKYQKEAVWKVFLNLEEKLDTLFVRRGWDPIEWPSQATTHFNSANQYFRTCSTTHYNPNLEELYKIPTKINLLKNGYEYLKMADSLLFANLEQKLDSLLHWEYQGLPQIVNSNFESADVYFDSVNKIYFEPVEPGEELDKIETMLDLFAKGLKHAKDAKWLMFYELEDKIDSLPSTGIREVGEKETLPEKFVLLQNYPNPFNPITNIEFMIPEPAHVRIEIFNVLGEKIVTLVDQKLGAGYKIVEWDGKDDQGREVSTGIYFYKLKAGDFTQTKKMVLLK